MDNKIKTGTTCVGLKFKGGVMLAADKRVTTYKIESDMFTKIFDVASNAVATVAGGAADAQLFIRYLKSQVKLYELNTERQIRVSEIAAILNSVQYSAVRSQGSIVSVILGGHDKKNGVSLFELSPDGTMMDHEPYVTTGSGSLYTKSVLDTEYKVDMSEKEALELVEKAYKASFRNDNASGGGYTVKVVTSDGVKDLDNKVVKTELVSN